MKGNNDYTAGQTTNGEDSKTVDTTKKKCEGCGANMVYDPDTNFLVCKHCGSKSKIEYTGNASELDLTGGFSQDKKWNEDEAVVFRCDNCGAKVVLTQGETAKHCPFCGTAYVQKSDELAGLKPNALVPFAFGVERALEFCKKWAKKKFFAPRKFKKNIVAENLQGVYTPCFTFDSHTTSTYVGRVGTRHTRVVGSGKNRRTETYIVWRSISGTYYSNFDDVLITAGSKFNQEQLDRISPYQTNESINYTEKYLLGYMAYHYDDELTDCWANAKGKIDARLRNLILGQYRYDVVDYLNVSTTHERVTYKYVMLPVYMGNFNYQKKLYNFYINGATGRVGGRTPKSPLKIGGLVLGICAVVGFIGYLIYKINAG